MSYGQMPPRNSVTMIEELPDLSDLENPSPYQQSMQHKPSAYGRQQQLANTSYGRGENLPPDMERKYQKFIRQRHMPMPQSGMVPMHSHPQEAHMHAAPPEPDDQPGENSALRNISCLEIADHIKDCPICSRFYNCDKTVYIICIVVLAIVCLLLLKRVLNV